MAIIYGTYPIMAALEKNQVSKIMVQKDYKNQKLLDQAKKSKVKVEFVDKNVIDKLAKGNNQGVLAYTSEYHTVGLEEILSIAKKKENPIIVILDELNDPHNLGAILRSSDAFDVSGVIYKKRGSVSLNDTVAKVSTGAINFIKCAEVTNLTQSIQKLKKEGFWVIGLDGGSEKTFKDVPRNCPIAVVVGSEGFGISRLVRENCDLIVKIPMMGNVNCLNASVACGIALFALRN